MNVHEKGSQRNRSPQFEMVTFAKQANIPNGWDSELLSKGAPKALFGRYEAADKLTLLHVPGYGPLVCFGTTMLTNHVCLDPATGAVLETEYQPPETGRPESDIQGQPGFANSSLDQFIATVRAVLSRFPFDRGAASRDVSESGTEECAFDTYHSDWDQAVDDMMETVQAIDPAAVSDEYTFWRTFLDDVQMGDFSTELLLSDPTQ